VWAGHAEVEAGGAKLLRVGRNSGLSSRSSANSVRSIPLQLLECEIELALAAAGRAFSQYDGRRHDAGLQRRDQAVANAVARGSANKDFLAIRGCMRPDWPDRAEILRLSDQSHRVQSAANVRQKLDFDYAPGFAALRVAVAKLVRVHKP
jgi:hypothetical protein